MKTREQLLEENTRLRAAVREASDWAGVRQVAARIHEEAMAAVVPDYRNGLLKAVAILDGAS